MAKKTGTKTVKREPPPLMLLALVGQFLADNGFSSSCRIYNTERRKRPKSEGWMDTFGAKYTAGVPALEAIFRTWQKEHKIEANPKDSDSGSSSNEENASDDQSTSSGDSESDSEESASEEGSDVSMEDVEEVRHEQIENPDESGSSSSSESESESNEVKPVHATKLASEVPGNSLKRKAPASSSDSSSDADTDSDMSNSDTTSSEDEAPPTKKLKAAVSTSPKSDSDSEDEQSSTSEGSESESESESGSESESESLKAAVNTELPTSSASDSSSSEESSEEDEEAPNGVSTFRKASSDSSGTVTGEVKPATVSEDTATVAKKRHIGAHPTRLAQISAAADSKDYISNDYVSYEYADKAYRDLSVTRGKGFTKEKNKKKRGSYRGGAIDISGGKGIKFAD